MPKAYNARCIVLGKTKLAEIDAILTLLSEDGRQIRAVAKGVRRPGSRIGARLELFSTVDALFHPGKNLDIVSEVRSVETGEPCRDGIERTAACAVVCEFVSKTSRDGALEGSRAFALTQTALRAIGQSEPAKAPFLASAHLLKAMAMQGLKPALHECVSCGQPCDTPAIIDIAGGGVVCPSCAASSAALGGSSQDVSVFCSWLDLILGSTFVELEAVDSAPVGQVLDFVDSWAGTHLSVRLKSMSFLRSLLIGF